LEAVSPPVHTAPDLDELLPLIGDRAFVVQPRRIADTAGGGGDVDLVVDGLDPGWPLRLPSGWRLCQVLHYDIKGWYWVLDHGGETVALDTVDDPDGLGRDGVPTDRMIELAERHPETAKAAYLTVKRIRKGLKGSAEWARIGELAAIAPEEYLRALSWTFGDRVSSLLASDHEWVVPPGEISELARRVQWLRRRRTPNRLIDSLWASTGRWYRRLTQPTGLFILVVGPDGSGKSSLAEALPALCTGPFRGSKHFHWRPGLLPRAGALLRVPLADPSDPHSRPPHGVLASVASLGYHWLDFLVGGWLRIEALKMRSGLIVMERGWWDIAIDPRRYRIGAPTALVRLLGRLLPQPDLVIALEAPTDVLMARKSEIEPVELERQTRAWRSLGLRHTKQLSLDAARPEAEVRATAREAVFSALTQRASGRLGYGWVALPSSSSPRWLLPRGPRATALSGLSVYQPVTFVGRAGWEAGRSLATIGLFRLLPRGGGPPEEVRELVAPYMPRRATLAVMRTNHAHRCVVSIVDPSGQVLSFAKVALDQAGDAALGAEADGIEAYGKLLSGPLRAPRVLERAPGVLLLEAIPWSARLRPWVLPPDVALGLGRAFAASSERGDRGLAHGDVAPWNLLRTQDGWVLVDWEDSHADAPPFYDVFHYLIQAAVLLRRPSLRAFTGAAPGVSWMRDAIRAFAEGAGLSQSTWRQHLGEYLSLSMENLDPSDPEQAKGLAARQGLLGSIV
jgi:Phosphotransferase enzyme family